MKLIVGVDLKEILDLSEKNDGADDVMVPSRCESNCNRVDDSLSSDSYIGKCLYFYDIGKVSTQSREYDSILNIKNSYLSPLIISPSQTRSINTAKTSGSLEQFNT